MTGPFADAALVCRDTGTRYPLGAPIWRSDSGGLLDLEFKASFPIDAIRSRPTTMWRYREAIPIQGDEHIVTLGEGFTPLVGESWNNRRVLLKLDTVFPSGSYKDRGASVLLSQVKRLGIRHIVEDSSGNAGAAIAAYGARAGVSCDIYVPASASVGKLVQVQAAGARLVRVPGTRADTSTAVWSAAQAAYYASHSWNPFFFHGTKTFAFEIVEQLGWKAPDAVVIPTGNGTLLLGAYIGFTEMLTAGVIDRLPKLIAVQAGACDPLTRAWTSGANTPAAITAAETIAEGVAIPAPIRGPQCLEAVRATGGRVVSVTDAETKAALRVALSRGHFIEPTSATALAALDKVPGQDGTIVLALTGHGLKSPDTIAKLVG